MDSMNFLSKKYTSVYSVHNLHNAASLSQSRQRSSKAFIPAHNLHHAPSSQQFHEMRGQGQNILTNHCQTHPQEMLRHLCLDCIDLLCSECIGEHISIHRENSTFPNIQTTKQLKNEMQLKLEELTELISSETHPKTIASSIEVLRKESCSKLDILHKQITEQVDCWMTKLKESLINNIKYEEIEILQSEMYSMYEEINVLRNSLGSGSSVHDVKKAYQIDGAKLESGYKEMLAKCKRLSEGVKIEVELNEGIFIEGIEKAVVLRGLEKERKRWEENVGKINIEEGEDESFRLEEPLNSHQNILSSVESVLSQVPLLFNMIPGTNTLKIQEPVKSSSSSPQVYSLSQVTVYPLSSLCLLPDGMAIVSGGMIAENKKSNRIEIFDYVEEKLVSSESLIKPRSSHKTIVYEDRIYFIGGFNENNEECCDVEVLKVNGIEVCRNKCRWGGPSLCSLLGQSVVKITLNGVEIMDLDSGIWDAIAIDVPFNISKGMQMMGYAYKESVQMVIFGDDEYYYEYDVKAKKFKKFENGISKPVLSAVNVSGKIYGLVDDEGMKVVTYDGKWRNGG